MHTDPDDLSELERRLSARRPTADGLDADAMLFAAGRAAGPPRRVGFVWPALTGFLTVLALTLGGWAMAERAERLASALPQGRTADTPPELAPPPADPLESGRSADDWLTARRALEEGLEAWPPLATPTPESPMPGRPDPVFTVGQRNTMLEP